MNTQLTELQKVLTGCDIDSACIMIGPLRFAKIGLYGYRELSGLDFHVSIKSGHIFITADIETIQKISDHLKVPLNAVAWKNSGY